MDSDTDPSISPDQYWRRTAVKNSLRMREVSGLRRSFSLRSFRNKRKQDLFSSDDEQSSDCSREDRKSKSTDDVNLQEPDSPLSGSPPISRRKKLWRSIKNSTRMLRSKSRERKRRSQTGSEDGIHPDDVDGTEPGLSPTTPTSPYEFETMGLYDQPNENGDSETEGRTNGTLERNSLGRATLGRNATIERMGSEEGDSGIAGDPSEAATLRQRHNALRSHPFFVMEVILKEGRDLVIRDSCGTSDPYVKFKIGNRQVYKSRTIFKNLNPKWEEKFTIPIEDPFRPISLRVYDYDRGLNDDPMGGAEIDPSSLELDKTSELKLALVDEKKKKKEEYMGFVTVKCTLKPKTQDEKEQYFKKQNKQSDAKDKKKTQTWSAIVTIVLVEGKGLMAMDDNGYSDPYVKFRLGNERYKSKYKSKTLKPRWLERFDLLMYDDQTSTLEISVWDHDIGGKDDIMGRADLDLSELAPEQTHRIWVELEDGAGEISCYISITGLAADHEASSIEHQKFTPEDREAIVKKYSLKNSARNMNDVGWLRVKVIKAQGLASADIGGKSDPFCVLELGNDRVQTHTEYKTLDPEWGKVFHFTIRDIHANLEVQVFDEDRDRKVEYLGKVAIPLLRIKRKERKWYGLKDRKLMHSVKGAVQLEMDVVFNHLKAAIRTVNPKEEKFVGADVKFKLAIMKKNIARVSKLAEAGVEGGLMLKSILAWESYPKSIGALIGFLVGVYSFELYMVPLSLLLVFLINLVVVHIVGNLMKEEEEYVDEEDDEDEDDDKNEKRGLMQKVQAIQAVGLSIQEKLDVIATLGEQVKNTFNWTVPWLAWLAMTALTIGTVVLYYVPIRYLLLAWGLNKFTKKLRKPNAIDNNELLDYLSRVPSDKELMMYRELRPDANIGTMKKRK